MSTMHFDNEKEMGLCHVKLWLVHETLVKVIVENKLSWVIYQSVMSHKEGLKILYGFDYQNDSYTE